MGTKGIKKKEVYKGYIYGIENYTNKKESNKNENNNNFNINDINNKNLNNNIKNDNNLADKNKKIQKNTNINNIDKNNINDKNLNDIEKYFNPKTGLLDEDGMIKIGNDLNIDIYTNMFFPYFLYKCSAKQLDQITKNEYNKGLNYFNTKSILNISKTKINNFQLDILSEEFNKYYDYIFNLNKKGNNIDVEIIEVYYLQLFNKYKIINDFILFLKDKKIKNLTKDQYFQFYELIKIIGNKYPEGYNPEFDSWPCLFDEFYYFYCDKNNIKYEKPNENYY
jgi:hypothetical protein